MEEGKKGNTCDQLKTCPVMVPPKEALSINIYRQEEWRGKAVVCTADGLLIAYLVVDGPCMRCHERRTSG